MVENKKIITYKKIRNIEIHNCYLAQTKYMRLESKITLFQNTRKLTYELKNKRKKIIITNCTI